MWELEDKGESQVSWRAMRSGGLDEEVMSLRAIEFFEFSNDRMLSEKRRKFLFDE